MEAIWDAIVVRGELTTDETVSCYFRRRSLFDVHWKIYIALFCSHTHSMENLWYDRITLFYAFESEEGGLYSLFKFYLSEFYWIWSETRWKIGFLPGEGVFISFNAGVRHAPASSSDENCRALSHLQYCSTKQGQQFSIACSALSKAVRCSKTRKALLLRSSHWSRQPIW